MYIYVYMYLHIYIYIQKSICFNILLFTQPAIACSKLTIETLEQDVKYVQS